jgi:hypothetical protein
LRQIRERSFLFVLNEMTGKQERFGRPDMIIPYNEADIPAPEFRQETGDPPPVADINLSG